MLADRYVLYNRVTELTFKCYDKNTGHDENFIIKILSGERYCYFSPIFYPKIRRIKLNMAPSSKGALLFERMVNILSQKSYNLYSNPQDNLTPIFSR